jgi:hypothetical protein
MGLDLSLMNENTAHQSGSTATAGPFELPDITHPTSSNSHTLPQPEIANPEHLLETVKASKSTISEARRAISNVLLLIDSHGSYFSEACRRSSDMLLRYHRIREIYETGELEKLRQVASRWSPSTKIMTYTILDAHSKEIAERRSQSLKDPTG